MMTPSLIEMARLEGAVSSSCVLVLMSQVEVRERSPDLQVTVTLQRSPLDETGSTVKKGARTFSTHKHTYTHTHTHLHTHTHTRCSNALYVPLECLSFNDIDTSPHTHTQIHTCSHKRTFKNRKITTS